MLLADFAEQARLVILPGFTRFDDAVADLTEWVVESDDELDEDPATDGAERVTASAVPALVRQLWDARTSEQRDWTQATDADRLAAAFAALESDGIVARMNFTCCQTCGFAQIGDEVPAGRSMRGFVYFHQQDAEGLAEEPALLLLAFGALGAFGAGDQAAYEAASLDVGHQIVAAVEAAGLAVAWDGTTARRIALPDLRWRKRLPA